MKQSGIRDQIENNRDFLKRNFNFKLKHIDQTLSSCGAHFMLFLINPIIRDQFLSNVPIVELFENYMKVF